MRARVKALMEQGVHYRDIAKRLDLSLSLASYHVNYLETAGVVVSQPAAAQPAEPEALGIAGPEPVQGWAVKTVRRMAETGADSAKIHLATGLAPSAIAKHLVAPVVPAHIACPDCGHHVVCELKHDRQRAYNALSEAVKPLPLGLVVSYTVQCLHGMKAVTPEKG